MSKKARQNDKIVETASLKHLLDEAEKRRLRDDVVDVKKAILETERVLMAESPDMIYQIIDHVMNCQKIFVTLEHPSIAPLLPPEYNFQFQVPTELTPPRQRAYFLDRDASMRQIHCEARQEYQKGFYKQTIKVGETGKDYDSTMDRMEQASKVRGFGFNIYAVGSQSVREEILNRATSHLKPVLRMVSQRKRISYHPEGNTDLLIEMALEPIHFGETFTGYRWFQPKIDLEIKVAPEEYSTGMRHSLLAREEKRLMDTFPLKRQLVSSPTPGFEQILADMQEKAIIRDRFDAMGQSEEWWKNQSPAPQRLFA